MEMISDTVSNQLLMVYANEDFGPATLIPSIYTALTGLKTGVSAFNPVICGTVDTNHFYPIVESDTAVLIDFNPLGISQFGPSLMLSRLEWTDFAFDSGINPLEIQKGTQSGFSPSIHIRDSVDASKLGYADRHFDLLYQDFYDNKWHLLIGL